MSKVYIVQRSLMRDRHTGELRERDGIEHASRFGELVELLTPNASPFHPDPILNELHEKLQHIQPEDYLLLMGNPILIGWAAAIASHYSAGKVCMLQWSGTNSRYIPVEADILRHARSGFDETPSFRETEEDHDD